MNKQIWDVICVEYRSNILAEYLRQGYEPFSATDTRMPMIWLKKLVTIIVEDK